MTTNPMDVGRRRALALLGGAGSTVLAGCCLPSQFRRSDIIEPVAFADGPALFGATRQREAKRLPVRTIDAHAHFFNASDAAVTGYLVHSIGHTQSPSIRRLLQAMQGVIDALVKIAPTAAEEYASLHRLKAQPLTGREDLLRREIETRLDIIVEALHAEMARQGADRVYRDATNEVQRFHGEKALAGPVTKEELREALDMSPTRSRLALASGEHPSGLLQFVRCMLQERWMSLQLFRDGYEPLGVEAAFGALVDFDHWYRCSGRSNLRDQMKLHALMSRESKGYLMPIIAYNPWTDIVEEGAALELVQEAVNVYGFVGVKIYPPIGYLPYGNASATNLPDIKNGPDRRKLDDRLEKFFIWCTTHDVPVMAHGNSSMGRDYLGDELGGPEGWNNVVQLLKGRFPPPVVNIGHFGGDSECRQNWPRDFARLMAEPGGERIYADIGYWSALPKCTPDGAPCVPYARLDLALQANPRLGERLMYGTDWFMYVKQSDWWDYPHQVAAALRGRFDLERLMRDNALACFALEPGGRGRDRVLKHLRYEPEWLRA